MTELDWHQALVQHAIAKTVLVCAGIAKLNPTVLIQVARQPRLTEQVTQLIYRHMLRDFVVRPRGKRSAQALLDEICELARQA